MKKNYISYKNQITKALEKLDFIKIEEIEKKIYYTIVKKKKIFVCGNGGCASIASHFLCDFNKGIKLSSKNKILPKIISLNDNNSIITAISNDLNFDKIFSNQLENFYNTGDILITLSCSGSSKNIINALKFSKNNNLFSVSFTGFAKETIIKYSNINLDIGIKNYGVCEDMFQILMHMISQNIRLKYIMSKNIIL